MQEKLYKTDCKGIRKESQEHILGHSQQLKPGKKDKETVAQECAKERAGPGCC